ncbi:recombinase family protein [Patescibacteria group bacterium]|nr:recombinase family protein [Patescibacteria group bacterium]
MKKKYYIYLRKSTDSEDKQILSLDGQDEVVKDYAERHALAIVKEIRESFSAKKPGRPKFTKMIEDIKAGKADGLIVYKADRLTRNYVDLGILAELLESDKEIHDCSYGQYNNDSNGKFMLGLNTCLAKRKIDDLSEDTKRGLRQKAEMGWLPHFAPTGYINNRFKKTIELDPKKASYVRKIFELYDSGLYTIKKIAKRLSDEGMTGRKGGKFSKTSVDNILRNLFYCGYFKYKGEILPGKHEPIISKEFWQRVQDRMAGRSRRTEKSPKHFFMYRGFMFCGECGCSITAERKKGHVYYRCTKSKGNCSQPYIRQRDLEPQLVDMFSAIQINSKQADLISDELQKLYEKDDDYQKRITSKLNLQLEHLKEEKKKLFRKTISGEIEDEEMYRETKQDIENEIIQIQQRVGQLSESTYKWLEESSNLIKLCKQAKSSFLKADREEKLALLNYVSSNRVLLNRKVHFSYTKPFDVLVNRGLKPNWGG